MLSKNIRYYVDVSKISVHSLVKLCFYMSVGRVIELL